MRQKHSRATKQEPASRNVREQMTAFLHLSLVGVENFYSLLLLLDKLLRQSETVICMF